MARLPRKAGAAIAGALLLFTLDASARVIWRGDFSTGDISQWTKAQSMGPDRLQVVRDPIGGERNALRTTVRYGDDPINSSGNRNELVYTGDNLTEGSDRYYRWQTLWPEAFVAADYWQLFTQWHHWNGGGSPPVEFHVIGEEMSLGVLDHGTVWSTPLERGRWRDFVFHVKWSSDPRVGYVELWVDGELVVPKLNVATLFPNDGAYLKQGLYRKDLIRHEQTIFHTGMTIATTLEDLGPFAPPTPKPEEPAPEEPAPEEPAPEEPAPEEPAPEEPAPEEPAPEEPMPSDPGGSGGENTVVILPKQGCQQPGASGVLSMLGMLSMVFVARRRK